jgi:hypothetical protein
VSPAGYLARLIFRGKVGEFIRGEEIDHPVIQTKRLTISIREERRPWWILFPIIFILGWILVYFIVTYVN